MILKPPRALKPLANPPFLDRLAGSEKKSEPLHGSASSSSFAYRQRIMICLRRLILPLIPMLLGASTLCGQIATDARSLTDAEWQAVEQGYAEVVGAAFNGIQNPETGAVRPGPWSLTDGRWILLGKLTLLMANERSERLGMEPLFGPARFETGATGYNDAVTQPNAEGQMDGGELNDVRFDVRLWEDGPNPGERQFGPGEPPAPAKRLAHILLHEASHQCDSGYDWDGTTGPTDTPKRRLWWCAELKAFRIQIEFAGELKNELETDAQEATFKEFCTNITRYSLRQQWFENLKN